MVYQKNKWNEIPTKTKLMIICAFIELVFLGMLVESVIEFNSDFSLNDVVSDFTVQYIAIPFADYIYGESFQYDYSENKVILKNEPSAFEKCDAEYLKYNTPLDAYDAVLNNTLTCIPSNYIQSIIDDEIELKANRGGLVVVSP